MQRVEFPPDMGWPEGEWDVLAESVNIVGERFRLEDCAAFIHGATQVIGKASFGVRLEREPTNEHDPYAVKVIGFWEERGLFSRRVHERHIGYVPSKLAYRIGNEVEEGTAISARLVAWEVNPEGEDPLNVEIDILEEA